MAFGFTHKINLFFGTFFKTTYSTPSYLYQTKKAPNTLLIVFRKRSFLTNKYPATLLLSFKFEVFLFTPFLACFFLNLVSLRYQEISIKPKLNFKNWFLEIYYLAKRHYKYIRLLKYQSNFLFDYFYMEKNFFFNLRTKN
jgi:hypothetical protein